MVNRLEPSLQLGVTVMTVLLRIPNFHKWAQRLKFILRIFLFGSLNERRETSRYNQLLHVFCQMSVRFHVVAVGFEPTTLRI